MTLDSMRKTMPAESLWDPSSPDGGPTSDWNYHCGADTGAFGSLKHFSPSINARYGNGTSAADYLRKAQLAAYESHRAMFEAYSRNKYNNASKSSFQCCLFGERRIPCALTAFDCCCCWFWF